MTQLKGPNFDPRGTGFEERPKPRTKVIPNACIPTGNRRHSTAVREGRISFEVFAKNALERQAIRESKKEPLVKKGKKTLDGRGKDDNAQEVVQQRGEEGVQVDDQAVREEEGQERVLRSGEQARSRPEPAEKSQQHVPDKKKKGRRPQAPKVGDKRAAHKKKTIKERLAKIRKPKR